MTVKSAASVPPVLAEGAVAEIRERRIKWDAGVDVVWVGAAARDGWGDREPQVQAGTVCVQAVATNSRMWPEHPVWISSAPSVASRWCESNRTE